MSLDTEVDGAAPDINYSGGLDTQRRPLWAADRTAMKATDSSYSRLAK